MIRRFILSLIVNSAALYAIDYFVLDFCLLTKSADTCPTTVTGSIIAFAVGGLLLGILNFFIKPVLKLLSMPVTFLTMGLFMFVINAVVLWLLVWLINTLQLTNLHILVTGNPVWLTYLYTGFGLGIFNLLTHWLVKK